MLQERQRHYQFGPFRLDPAQQLLTEGDRKIQLTPKAFQTLLVLVENQGRIVEKGELLQKVWPDTFVEEATLAQNIFTLRKQLQGGRGDDGVSYIETVPKRGYRLVPAVRVEEPLEPLISHGQQVAAGPVKARGKIWLIVVFITVAAIGELLIWQRVHSARTRSRPMLAVLPVQNLTGDPNQEYLADGLTEELIAELGSLNPEQLGVIARTSAMTYKQTNKTVHQIGKELGVDYVLESSLRGGSGQVRFTAQLIRVRDQTHLWTQNYNRAMADVLVLQDELARTVAEQIRVELPRSAATRLASSRPVKPEAYDAYSKGRYFWNQRTPEAMTIAENYFQQAIRADPNFAPAYAGLADCYQIMVNLGQRDINDGFRLAKAETLKAMELDPTLAEAHASLASIMGDFEWDWQGAETEYKRALELNPNYATAHHWYGEFLAGMGRYAEGTAEIQKAHELDPLSPVIGVSLGQMYCRLGQCQTGIEQIKKTLEIYPDFAEGHEALGEIYGYLGMYQQAAAELAEERKPPIGHVDLLLAYAAAKAGRIEEAKTRFQKSEGRLDPQQKNYYAATMFAAVGQNDKAFAQLENALRNHDPFMAYVGADIKLESLRSDPRYRKLIRRMNMPVPDVVAR